MTQNCADGDTYNQDRLYTQCETCEEEEYELPNRHCGWNGDAEGDGGNDRQCLLKSFVTSDSDLKAIWKRLANHFVLGICLGFLLIV